MNDTLFENPPVLEGKRIRLVPMEFEHVKPLFKINDPSIWTYTLTEIRTEKEMEDWVAEAIRLRLEKTALPFVVIIKDTNQVAGATRLFNMNGKQRCCELGSTWYGVEYQRTFVNSEAKFLLLQFCFEELGLIRVQLKTDERNLRSQAAIERLGAVKEGILRNERILHNGYIRNAVLYSITNQEWEKVKQGLLEREKRYALSLVHGR
ncbi:MULTISPECIES: GNAT family N-acetyltransferase [unclassified Thermoactinomyces]|jgi:RimJ/RimL family protein N-acetyltransferase|uniref:GNAT family N-acetyltransferase n=1 Tax=unclassified Thermoactinomyces TaxID=2634588 RepID=UPI0018DE003B|nr:MULTISPECIES: GNAT family protein [unclassified Thermoactinomyces]MBH8599391.1 GNAT family N-acetyltransferase [Thermoactinomyces sp. CICC 10523]MBH8605173.1 GNAT family N-acetyltransferase [Thermoactinomyces sp. CICC 10522]